MDIKLHLITAIFAIPFGILFIWAITNIAFCAGLAMPYICLDEKGLGFWRVVIFGSLINILLILGCALMIWISENWMIDNELRMQYMISEAIVIFTIVMGYEKKFSW